MKYGELIDRQDVSDTSVGDTIYRQAAIDVLDVLCQEHRYKIPGKMETYSQYNEAWQDALDRAEGAIFNLPSAQPERNMNNKVNLCDSCRKVFPECESTANDIFFGNGVGNDNVCACPHYEPKERKKGKWVDGKCDQCGGHAPFWPMASTYYRSRFCPNCGSFNGGEE